MHTTRPTILDLWSNPKFYKIYPHMLCVTTPLHLAIRAKKLDQVKILCERGENVNDLDATGYSCLHLAVDAGDLDIVKVLCQNKAKMNITNANGSTALHVAIRANKLDIIKILCEHARAHARARTHTEPKIVPDLSAFDLDIKDGYGSTAMHIAIKANNFNVVSILCANGVNLKERDANGSDCLHLAIEMNNPAIVKILCENTADVNATDKCGQSCLYLATKKGSITIIKMLIQFGADLNMLGELGYTPLHWAIRTQSVKIVEAFIEHGADVNARYVGTTALHAAISQHINIEIIRELILAKADMTIKDGNGETALDVARGYLNREIIELIEFGIASNIKSARKLSQ